MFSVWKLTSLGLLGMVVTFFAGQLSAQTTDKNLQAKDAIKPELLEAPHQENLATLIRAGYTRPGNPSDMVKDGKVMALAWDDDYKGRYLGATVYFAVYERTGAGAPGDVFGTGHPGIDELFKEGRSATGQYSPGIDTTARYLYVYQVVNDRGLDPKKEVPIAAPWRDFRTEDIVTATVKLLVDPREITSWGHFSNSAFAARVADRNLRGKVQLAADGKNERMLSMALSSNPSILEALPYHEYLAMSPALTLHDLKNNFGMERSNLNLINSAAYKELADLKAKGVKLVAWQDNMVVAAKGGNEPTYIQLDTTGAPDYTPGVSPGDGLIELLPEGQNPARGYLRVDWRGDQIIKLGENSVAFGFTSNLPPVDDVVRVVSAAKEIKAGVGPDAIAAVGLVDGNGPGVGPGQVVGPGTVPTPMPLQVGASGGTGCWLAGQLGGVAGGGFFGGWPIRGFGGFGGFGGPTAPFVGGGGGGGSSGSGTQAQFQNQSQSQAQAQQQSQQQSQTTAPPGHVVPEPAAIALGLLGLPALYLALRRRKGASAATPSS